MTRSAGAIGRRDRVRARLAADGLNALVVTSPANIRYLTGFSGSQGTVIIGDDPSRDRLVTDGRYELRAQRETSDLAVVISTDVAGVAVETVEATASANVGLESEHLTWADARRWQERLSDAKVASLATSGIVEAARTIKDATEIAAIAAACAMTTEAMKWAFDHLRSGQTEHEICVALERRFIDLGADGIAFPSIVACGINGAVPHHRPTHRQVEQGELVTVDCGAIVDGYHADCTRTVAVGNPSSRMSEMHALVVEAQQAGVDATVAGLVTGDVDAAARSIIDDAGYSSAFVHGTGHGVGLEIHEAPSVTRGSTATLEVGTVITVEPGIYLADVGGVRIEDTLVVTDQGPQTLTDLERQLVVV
ncbi:MAG: Xaa-Pro peptidase family protein [Nitriliruptoraceae bacterium]